MELQSGPFLLDAHHVIPQADGHLSVSSLADVETVHREETRVRLAHLVKKDDGFSMRFTVCEQLQLTIHLNVLPRFEG